MTTKIFVARDAAAASVGAEDVAATLRAEATRRRAAIEVVRTGSRGLCFLEPLVEIERAEGVRHAYGPVGPKDVPTLLDAMLTDRAHPLALGPTEALPYLARQDRVTLGRAGRIVPDDLTDYAAHGGWRGLEAALATDPAQIVEALKHSGLRGRGGAAFPAGIKWHTAAQASGRRKHVVANADEGDSGTFSDRLVMEADPFVLLEGMIICALAIGAEHGWIYLRSEYPDAEQVLRSAIAKARAAGYLGRDVCGSGRAFDVTLRRGAGAYICGEETALLESLEGKRGVVRAKPPVPAIQGLFGDPTVVHNVVTLASVPFILAEGAEAYARRGVGRSRGTLPFQLAGNVQRGGIVEVPFGMTLRELVEDFGGGTASGRPLRAVQVGGPLGPYLPATHLDVPLDYEAFAAVGGMIGHGGVVVFDDTVDMAKMARYAMEFCAIESCGKCTPCRIGAVRGVEVIDEIRAAGADTRKRSAKLQLLRDLCDTMVDGSLCAMGGMTPLPVRSALEHFAGDFER
jgi:formate dehydrogenase iron-sulfur subunit